MSATPEELALFRLSGVATVRGVQWIQSAVPTSGIEDCGECPHGVRGLDDCQSFLRAIRESYSSVNPCYDGAVWIKLELSSP